LQAASVNTGYPASHQDAAAPLKLLPAAAPALLVALGCLALAVGLLVYMADRDATRVWLLPHGAVLHGGPLFGALGGWLPAFVHPFAFSLFSAATLRRKAVPAYRACAAWWAVNLLFEAAQHPHIQDRLAKLLPLADGPDVLANYCRSGTFDAGDVVAATAGALAAALTLCLVHHWETRHAP